MCKCANENYGGGKTEGDVIMKNGLPKRCLATRSGLTPDESAHLHICTFAYSVFRYSITALRSVSVSLSPK